MTTHVARRIDTKRIAAIDIGSNSIRQIVADVSPEGEIFVVDEMKAAPRLGRGLDSTGELQPQAMDAAVEALGRMALLARQMGASRVDAVATSAVRDASNSPAFLERIRREAKLRVRLLDGEAEARLSFRSALAHFDLGAGRAVVMDIGGGSLELAASVDGVLEQLTSLPLGAIRLTERFFPKDTSPRRLRQLRSEVRDAVKPMLPLRDWRGAQLIGSGGTFTNLAEMQLARQGVQSARSVHGTVVPRADLEHLIAALRVMSPADRAAVPGLNPARADIILAGLAVAAEVMARLEARELVVSRYGIREGILLDAARVQPAIADPGEARERSVRELAERCRFEGSHARTVQHLALRLFDRLGPRLGCTAEDRALLSDAALLHDVGYHISYDKHHKHSYHLIAHADLLGMSPVEQIMIANVARYHRGARPKKRHRNFGQLDRSLRARVEVLAAILRVADGLDRGHAGSVQDVAVRWTKSALRITPRPASSRAASSLSLELWGAHRKSALLDRVTGVPIEIVAPDGAVLRSDQISDSAA